MPNKMSIFTLSFFHKIKPGIEVKYPKVVKVFKRTCNYVPYEICDHNFSFQTLRLRIITLSFL